MAVTPVHMHGLSAIVAQLFKRPQPADPERRPGEDGRLCIGDSASLEGFVTSFVFNNVFFNNVLFNVFFNF